MNDLFRAIFGRTPKDEYDQRMTPPKDYRENLMRNRDDDTGDNDHGGHDDDDDDNMRSHPGGGFFDFSIFNDPSEIHNHFERLVNEMNKAFGVFRFDISPSISWEDESRNMSACSDNSCQRTENLRDLYLKQPEGVHDNNNSINVIINENEPGTSGNLNLDNQVPQPRIFSKSVFIQTIKRPDGSVETIKKVYDHTGKETIITQSNMNDPLLPPQGPSTPEDNSGISLLRKFFTF